MKEIESIKDYSSRLMDVVNQVRLFGEAFTYQKEQRVSIRGDVSTEGAFLANQKGRYEGPSRKGIFSPCSHCRRTNHVDKDCWYKDKPSIHCNFCKKLGHNKKYYRAKKKQSEQPTQQVNMLAEDDNNDEHLFMASQSIGSQDLNTWLIDSGCTSHMTRYLSIFMSIDISVQPKLKLGNGDIVQAKGKGQVAINTTKGTKIIANVLYIPELDQNLLSVAQMIRNGYGVSFKDTYCLITDVRGVEIAKLKMTGNSFYLKLDLVEGHIFSAKIDESVV
ncbi:uncharacterized protein LOC141685138 [Apium graveolens]|uniref:uncharacterized protein LOC141685138 n=1 Tax=Apium graveolens TaxID=4045 RepID=UPI003D792FB2